MSTRSILLTFRGPWKESIEFTEYGPPCEGNKLTSTEEPEEAVERQGNRNRGSSFTQEDRRKEIENTSKKEGCDTRPVGKGVRLGWTLDHLDYL